MNKGLIVPFVMVEVALLILAIDSFANGGIAAAIVIVFCMLWLLKDYKDN